MVYYPENACYLAPLRPESIPVDCVCLICRRRKEAQAPGGPFIGVCAEEYNGDETYFGRIVFPGGDETCPNHKTPVKLVKLAELGPAIFALSATASTPAP